MKRYKIVLVGDSAVGKTSILGQYVNKGFNNMVQPTIASGSVSVSIHRNSGDRTLDIWDTAGQERYRSVVKIFFRSASACILIYDVSCRKSFENLMNWYHTIQEEDSAIKTFLVANKKDLANTEYEVLDSEAQKFADKINASGYFKVSAKTDDGIDALFQTIADTKMKETETFAVTQTMPDVTTKSCC